MYNINGLNEECGVFAVVNNDNAPLLSYYGLHSLQHRGQDAAGIALMNDGLISVIKGPGLVSDVLSDDIITKSKGHSLIGHVRYGTAGGSELANIQPLHFNFHNEAIALAHNGHIANGMVLKKELEQKGSVFSTSSDSELLIHLIRSEEDDTLLNRLMFALPYLEGAFAFIILHKCGVYGIRDKNGLRPLSIGQFKDGSYTLSSETCAFSIVGAKFVRDVLPGEIIKIDENNVLTSSFYSKDTSTNLCLMEYVYFSRPDSSLDGTNVHFARKLSGKILAQEAYVDADIVVGVPDSSTSAAIGYAEQANIPYEIGLIKNRYVGRTFIQPTQELREKGVRMKLSAVSEIVAGKKIILIDDSIVRGTTSKRIVTLLKEAGAKEVHVRIAAPAIKYPCYYGVDISTFDELISNRLDEEELCDYINADSLAFLNLESLKKALVETKNETCLNTNRYCSACFNGEYVTKLYSDLKDVNK